MVMTYKDQTLLTMSQYISCASRVLPKVTVPMLGLLCFAAMVTVWLRR